LGRVSAPSAGKITYFGDLALARAVLKGPASAQRQLEPTQENTMDIQNRLTSFANLGASWVMWLLIALSVAALTVALERALYLARTRDDLRRLKKEVLGFLRRGDLQGARGRLGTSRSVEAQVVAAGLEHDGGTESAEQRMSAAAQTAKLQMEKRLAFLGTLGTNAPFLGLLGTVIGIIRAFHALNDSAGRVTAGLMAEVGEALVATAIGILVALPAIAFFNAFQRIIKARLTRADAFGKEVLAVLKDRPSARVTPIVARVA
jgi:biopolymer transport protein ExbB